MNCQSQSRNSRGFTLLETILAVSAATLILLAVFKFNNYLVNASWYDENRALVETIRNNVRMQMSCPETVSSMGACSSLTYINVLNSRGSTIISSSQTSMVGDVVLRAYCDTATLGTNTFAIQYQRLTGQGNPSSSVRQNAMTRQSMTWQNLLSIPPSCPPLTPSSCSIALSPNPVTVGENVTATVSVNLAGFYAQVKQGATSVGSCTEMTPSGTAYSMSASSGKLNTGALTGSVYSSSTCSGTVITTCTSPTSVQALSCTSNLYGVNLFTPVAITANSSVLVNPAGTSVFSVAADAVSSVKLTTVFAADNTVAVYAGNGNVGAKSSLGGVWSSSELNCAAAGVKMTSVINMGITETIFSMGAVVWKQSAGNAQVEVNLQANGTISTYATYAANAGGCPISQLSTAGVTCTSSGPNYVANNANCSPTCNGYDGYWSSPDPGVCQGSFVGPNVCFLVGDANGALSFSTLNAACPIPKKSPEPSNGNAIYYSCGYTGSSFGASYGWNGSGAGCGGSSWDFPLSVNSSGNTDASSGVTTGSISFGIGKADPACKSKDAFSVSAESYSGQWSCAAGAPAGSNGSYTVKATFNMSNPCHGTGSGAMYMFPASNIPQCNCN